MALDPISFAQQKIKLNDIVTAAQTTNNQLVVNKASEALTKLNTLEITPLVSTVAQSLPKLPVQIDSSLLKKIAEARAQTIKAEAELLLQKAKEEELTNLKNRVNRLAPAFPSLPGFFLKLPITDPKYLAHLTFLEAKERIRELKQKASKENLKKSKEAFTFPMKPPTRFDLGLTAIPDVPKIPNIPTL